MRKFLFSLLAVALCVPAFAGLRQKQADKDTNQFRYEIECAGNAIQGTYLVKVWTYSKKASVAENQCRKSARSDLQGLRRWSGLRLATSDGS